VRLVECINGTPPVFDGDNYQMWIVRMETYLEALNLWEAVEEDLIREFELQRMKKSKSVKEYSDRLLSIANKVRLLGSVLKDSRIVEKLLVTVPERFEVTITP